DRFSRIERLGTPCRERERLKALFNVFRESDGKHGKFHQLLYTYSLAWNDDRGVSHRSMRGLRVSSQTFANTRRRRNAAVGARVPRIAAAAQVPVSQPPSMNPWLSSAQCSPAKCRSPTRSPIAPRTVVHWPGPKHA